jgi:hypothetical protein
MATKKEKEPYQYEIMEGEHLLWLEQYQKHGVEIVGSKTPYGNIANHVVIRSYNSLGNFKGEVSIPIEGMKEISMMAEKLIAKHNKKQKKVG